MLSGLHRLTSCNYLFGIFWSLCCLSFLDLRLVITSLVSFGHCVVCPSSTYGLWLPLWYLLVIVLSVLPRLTACGYLFGILWSLCFAWSLCCLSFLDLRFVITSLVSFGHCVVFPSSTYGLWLPLWYLLVIVLSGLPRLTACNYLFGIFWSLCCLSFLDLRLVITSLVSFGHCVVSPSSTYGLWLPLWYLLVIVLSVLPRLTACGYLFGIFWSLCCLSFLDLRFVITSLVSFGHCVVCPSSTYGLWLPLWYLLVIVLSVLPRLTACDYLFGIFWSLCCLSFLDLRLVITSLVSFGHCVVCPSSTYGLWLPLWYLLVIVLSVLPRLTACGYLFGIFWSLCCLSFLDLRLVITSLVSFGHCVVCPSSTYGLWLPLWYLLVIVLSVLHRLTSCNYLFGIFWSLCCLSFLDLRLVITSLVSFGHCVVCPSSTYGLWLPLWYLLVIVLSVLPRLTACGYLFGIFWSLCCLSFLDLRLVITSGIFWSLCCLSFLDLRLVITSLVSSIFSFLYVLYIHVNTLPKGALMVEVCIGTISFQNLQQYGCQTGNKLKEKSRDLNRNSNQFFFK